MHQHISYITNLNTSRFHPLGQHSHPTPEPEHQSDTSPRSWMFGHQVLTYRQEVLTERNPLANRVKISVFRDGIVPVSRSNRIRADAEKCSRRDEIVVNGAVSSALASTRSLDDHSPITVRQSRWTHRNTGPRPGAGRSQQPGANQGRSGTEANRTGRRPPPVGSSAPHPRLSAPDLRLICA